MIVQIEWEPEKAVIIKNLETCVINDKDVVFNNECVITFVTEYDAIDFFKLISMNIKQDVKYFYIKRGYNGLSTNRSYKTYVPQSFRVYKG